MKTKLYLHVGMNKAGSSAIQRFLSMNREQLAAHGLLYPVTGLSGDAHYAMSSVLGFVQGLPKRVDLLSKPVLDLCRSLKNEVEFSSAKTLVISSEDFVLPNSIETVQDFFRDYDVKIVFYLRRHDKWWLSAYNQAVRMVVNPPWTPGFKSYLSFYDKYHPEVGDYRVLIDRWSAEFGKENIIVRPYEAQQNVPSLEVDFLNAVGQIGLVDALEFDCLRVNESVDMSTLALIDVFQRARVEPAIRSSLINYALANRKASEAGVIEPGLLRMLAEKYHEDYVYIAREYLGRDDGRLFYDPMPDPSVTWKNIPIPTNDEIVEMVVEVLMRTANLNVTDPQISKAVRG